MDRVAILDGDAGNPHKALVRPPGHGHGFAVKEQLHDGMGLEPQSAVETSESKRLQIGHAISREVHLHDLAARFFGQTRHDCRVTHGLESFETNPAAEYGRFSFGGAIANGRGCLARILGSQRERLRNPVMPSARENRRAALSELAFLLQLTQRVSRPFQRGKGLFLGPRRGIGTVGGDIEHDRGFGPLGRLRPARNGWSLCVSLGCRAPNRGK